MLDDVKLALLGDRDAQERITARGELLPCAWCGGHAQEMRFNYHFRIQCESCRIGRTYPGWIQEKENGECVSGEESALKLYYHPEALDEARANWNTRVPILTPEELDILKGDR